MGWFFSSRAEPQPAAPAQAATQPRASSSSESVDPRWISALTGNSTSNRNIHMPCHHRSPPFGRSAWRLCSDLGVLRKPRFDIGKDKGPPDEGCLVISIGIGGSWDLEDRLASFGCEVHAFDPTFELQKRHLSHVFQKPRMHFHFLGLGVSSDGGSYGAVSSGRLKPLDELFAIARQGRLRQAVDVLKIDCEGCEWGAFADAAKRTPILLACVQHLLLEIHVTPRYGLKHVAQFNRLMGHTIDDHGFRLFHKPRRNRGFPWARNETLPALVKGGLDPVACCAELQFSRTTHSPAFRSHAAWLARLEPAYAEAQQAASQKFFMSGAGKGKSGNKALARPGEDRNGRKRESV